MKAQVISAGAAYFTTIAVRDPNGDERKDRDGNPIQIEQRHEATRGEKIDLTPYEFERLKALGAVRGEEDFDKPLFGPTQATPFSMPVPDPDNPDQQVVWDKPVMGNPEPNRPHNESLALSPEKLEELSIKARANESGSVTEPGIDVDDTSDEDLESYVEDHNVDETLALAKGDDGEYQADRAERVLAAEQVRDKPRSGVVDPLEKFISDQEA